MNGQVLAIQGVQMFLLENAGPPLRGEAEATKLLEATFEHGVDWLALPVERFEDDFFDLRTKILGNFIQKFVNYGVRLVVVGDVSRHLATSKALHAFAIEANLGESVWFVNDLDELASRMST